jgi:ATP-binding cassette subfamily C exporter for protease/lipase
MLTLITLGLLALMSLLEWIRSMVLVRVGARLDLDVKPARLRRDLRTQPTAGRPESGAGAARPGVDAPDADRCRADRADRRAVDADLSDRDLHAAHRNWGLRADRRAGAGDLAVVNERVSAGPLGEAQKLAMAANAQANNNLRNAEVIEAMGMLPAIRGRWFKLHQKFLMQQALASDRAGMLNALTRLRASRCSRWRWAMARCWPSRARLRRE